MAKPKEQEKKGDVQLSESAPQIEIFRVRGKDNGLNVVETSEGEKLLTDEDLEALRPKPQAEPEGANGGEPQEPQTGE